MVPQGALELENLVKNYAKGDAEWPFTVKEIDDTHLPYYTPADYCASVAQCAALLREGRKAK
jgi:hypothetical protein